MPSWCSPHPVDTINVPMGVLSISDYPYDMTMGRGANESTYTVRVYAGRASERSAAKLIADLMDPANPLNLKACVEGDSNLLMLLHGRADISVVTRSYLRLYQSEKPQQSARLLVSERPGGLDRAAGVMAAAGICAAGSGGHGQSSEASAKPCACLYIRSMRMRLVGPLDDLAMMYGLDPFG